MSLKVIPQAVDHLSVNEVQNPLREFEKRKQVQRMLARQAFMRFNIAA
jgi:hypothetical protein